MVHGTETEIRLQITVRMEDHQIELMYRKYYNDHSEKHIGLTGTAS